MFFFTNLFFIVYVSAVCTTGYAVNFTEYRTHASVMLLLIYKIAAVLKTIRTSETIGLYFHTIIHHCNYLNCQNCVPEE